jgi:hypothetical protein
VCHRLSRSESAAPWRKELAPEARSQRGIRSSENVFFVAIRKSDVLCCECVVAISNLASVAISLFFASCP